MLRRPVAPSPVAVSPCCSSVAAGRLPAHSRLHQALWPSAPAVPALQPAVCLHIASVVRAFKPAVCQRSIPYSLPAASTKPCGGKPLLFQRCSQPSNRQNFQNPWQQLSPETLAAGICLGGLLTPRRLLSIASVVPAHIPSVCQLSHLSNASQQGFCQCHLFLRLAQRLSISFPFFL